MSLVRIPGRWAFVVQLLKSVENEHFLFEPFNSLFCLAQELKLKGRLQI
jgi:hypothetical protein